MAIQQANDPANQIDYPHRQALIQFMNSAGNFLLEHWATLITWVLGVIVFAALSVPFLSYFGLDGISKQIFYALILCAAYALCANPITLLLYFRTSTGHVRSQLLHLQFDVCRQPDLCTE